MKTRVFCLFLSLVLLLGLCPAAFCEAPQDTPPDAWYEIFVRSFYDSDGDGLGDLNGVAEKLDYIASLGCGGIWLMPVMPSPSYHKYDVTDYYAVDPEYGTLEDMRALLEQAHARGMRVILDLPVNHCSSEHPWFQNAAQGPDAPYRDWFRWSAEPQDGYSECGGAWYESRFVASMPDLDLDNPAVREEITAILRFWLEEVGADGFRLDAVTSYYTGETERNIAFLDWLADTAHAIRPDCFLVAEAWTDLGSIARYSECRIDSFFTFPVSQSEGYIAKTLARVNRHPGRSYGEFTALLEETLPAGTIPAPFTENHDTGRTVGFTGRGDPAKTKMAGGLLCLMRGAVFLYYGQEIGMVGSGEDPNKRIGMLWTDEASTTLPPPGATQIEYAYPSVAEQEADPGSLLNYYRQALALRSRFPAIARGASTVLPCEEERICLIERRWEDEELLLVVNPSVSSMQLTPEHYAPGYDTLAAYLCTDPESAVIYQPEGTGLRMPPRSIAVLTKD